MPKQLSAFILLSLSFWTCSRKPLIKTTTQTPLLQYEIVDEKTNYPKRDFRGAWVATVANIDWPSKKGLASDIQQKEYSAIVKHHKELGLNALLVQVRASSDAFYAKSKEPWSEWLMGEQGKPPTPFYDPMEFMISETHKEGLEFHTWLNLNRGKHKLAGSVMPDHLVNTKPEWFLTYDGYRLYNFGLPEVRQYILDIVMNIAREYDVDGIHFDDYFYPYKVNGQELEDQSTFLKYGNGFDKIEDWRRNNIDLIIKAIGEGIKKEKSWVSFGISPFGVWRNKSDDPIGSETKGGQPSYDFLFADTRKWSQEGWIDYIAPQIYFPFEHNLVPYGNLTDWWVANHGKARLYIGHGVYRVDSSSSVAAWKDPNQMARQLDYNAYSSGIEGSIFYNTNTLIKNNLGVSDSIRARYDRVALVPVNIETKRGEVKPVRSIEGQIENLGLKLQWLRPDDQEYHYVIYRFRAHEKLNIGDPRHILSVVNSTEFIDRSWENSVSYIYLVTALDRWRNESKPVVLKR